MITDTPSKTALRVAMARAAHQAIDDAPHVLEDPFAIRILGGEARALLPPGRSRFRTVFARRMRAFVLARSRMAEDELALALRRGVRQYVVLGAGLDTFACRNLHAGALSVFEVDHPATQGWKRRLLADSGIAVGAGTRFVPVDFDTQPWLEALQQAGFRADVPTHVAWLGVSMYLAPPQVEHTFATVASFPRGSSLVFDYLLASSQLGFAHRALFRVLGAVVKRMGEPLRSRFAPAEIRDALVRAGFAEVEDDGPHELNARYFAGRTDGLAVGGIGRIACARV